MVYFDSLYNSYKIYIMSCKKLFIISEKCKQCEKQNKMLTEKSENVLYTVLN